MIGDAVCRVQAIAVDHVLMTVLMDAKAHVKGFVQMIAPWAAKKLVAMVVKEHAVEDANTLAEAVVPTVICTKRCG